MPSERYDLSERLPYLINRVGVALVAFATPRLKRHRLGIALWRVLAVLAHRGELRQVDLSGATSLDPPTISRLISQAARRGLVTRARSTTSQREVSIRLTRSGRGLVERLLPAMIVDEKAAVAGLSRAELATLKKMLRRMFDNVSGHRPAGGAKPRVARRKPAR